MESRRLMRRLFYLNEDGLTYMKGRILYLERDGKMKDKIGLIGLFAIAALGLLLLIAGANAENSEREIKASVIEVDNEDILSSGFSNLGAQILMVEIQEGAHQGEVVKANNILMGQNEYDEIYKAGDKIVLAIQTDGGQVVDAKPLSLQRTNWLSWLVLLMVAALLVYARMIGVKALLSFGFSLWVLWQYFIQGLLDGRDPIQMVVTTVIILSAVIIFLVSGLTRRGLTAFLGTVIGLLTMLLVTGFFGEEMGLHGMTQPYAQALVIGGYYDLDLRGIFYAAIILGASGAAMDISVDISASMQEILEKKPEITRGELIQSGFTIGRQVIGTMATTLLLAYSGSYLTLLMLFMARGTSLTRMMNMKIVAAEVMRTIIGSVGLVAVAPLTAIIGGFILKKATASRGEQSPSMSQMELEKTL